MSIQHKNIPDAQLHEPKGIISADGSSVYVSTGAGTGQWRRIRETDFDFSNPVENRHGWQFRADNQYTSGAPLALPANTNTNFSNNGLLLSNTTRDIGVSYNTNTTFIPSSINASYLVSIKYKVITTAVNTGLYTIKTTLAAGDSTSANNTFIKGGSYVNDICNTFVLQTPVLVAGVSIFIQLRPDVACSAYDMSFLIQRIYFES